MNCSFRVLIAGFLAAVGSMTIIVDAHGQGITNAIADGDWSSESTWDNGVPTDIAAPNDLSAFINGGHIVTVSQSGAIAPLLDIGTVDGASGTLKVTGGDLLISDSTPGVGNDLPSIRLGQVAGSMGTMNMSGGTVIIDGTVGSGFANGELLIGDNGTGTMNMTGGELTATDEVAAGLIAGSSGALNVSGGTLNVAGRNLLLGFFGPSETIATGAHGELNLSGTGTVNVNEFLFSSFFPGATSTMTQTGGTLNVGQAFVQGRNGNSTFDHSGGVINVLDQGNGDFVSGDNGPNNTYNISGTAEVNASRNYLIGVFADADATVNQSGGVINIGTGSSGGFVSLGRDGIGRWNQTGGEVNVTGSVFLGDFDSSSGTHKISGGTFNVSGNYSVGGALASNALPERVEPDGTNGPQGQALDANGTMIVSGSGATIDIGGNFLANPDDKSPFRSAPTVPDGDNSATLIFEIFDNTGTSLIDVAGVADLDGAVIDLDLMGGFTPTVGATFDLLTASSFGATGTGTTENVGTGLGYSLAAEDVGGFDLAVVAGGNGQILRATFLSVVGLTGDYNDDGKVDAADYTVWRDNLGGDGALLANRDPANSGAIGTADYTSWKTNFGALGAGGGALVSAAVPEPTTLVLAFGVLLGAFCRCRSRR